MFFYYFLLLLIFFILFSAKIKNKDKIVIILLTLISCLRFDVGFDYSSYYNRLIPTLDVIQVEKYELIPRYIYYIANELKSPLFLFSFFSISIMLFMYKGILNNSKNRVFSVYIFFCLFFLFTLGVIRQVLAISIMFYAFKYLVREKKIKFFICVIFATLCHTTALVSIPIYFLYNKPRIAITLMIIVLSLTKIILVRFIATSPYGFYLNEIENLSGGGIMTWFYICLFMICLLLNIKNKSNKAYNYKLLSIISPSLFLPFIFGGHIGMRLSYYFLVFYILLIPSLLSNFNKILKLITLLFLSLYFALNIYIDSKNPEKSSYTPYQIILTKNIYNPQFK